MDCDREQMNQINVHDLSLCGSSTVIVMTVELFNVEGLITTNAVWSGESQGSWPLQKYKN